MKDPYGYESHRPIEDHPILSGGRRPWLVELAQKDPQEAATLEKAYYEYRDKCSRCIRKECRWPRCDEPTRKPVETVRAQPSKSDPCISCWSAEVCRAHKGICNEKARWEREARSVGC